MEAEEGDDLSFFVTIFSYVFPMTGAGKRERREREQENYIEEKEEEYRGNDDGGIPSGKCKRSPDSPQHTKRGIERAPSVMHLSRVMSNFSYLPWSPVANPIPRYPQVQF